MPTEILDDSSESSATDPTKQRGLAERSSQNAPPEGQRRIAARMTRGAFNLEDYLVLLIDNPECVRFHRVKKGLCCLQGQERWRESKYINIVHISNEKK